MDKWIRRLFSEWSQSLDHHNLTGLDQPLMIRCTNNSGMLDINFNKYVPLFYIRPFFALASLASFTDSSANAHFHLNTQMYWMFFSLRLTLMCCLCRNILKMFNEIHYWERLKFEIPHFVSVLYQCREDMHTLRENVLLLVKDYNRSAQCSHAYCICRLIYDA